MSKPPRLPQTRTRPRVLIGVSCEGLSVADALRRKLDAVADVLPWRCAFYPLTGHALRGLAESLAAVDFAIFLLTSEDADRMRGEATTVARDNTLLQMGAALTALGPARTFLVFPRNFRRDCAEFHVAVDVLGMTPAHYDEQESDGDDYRTYALGATVSQISRVLAREGRRDAAPVAPVAPPELSLSAPPEAGPESAAPVSVSAPAKTAGPVRIRFHVNRRKEDRAPADQIQALRNWWHDLSEKQRRSIIRYNDVDRLLNLRGGTTRRYLSEIAEADGYIADHEIESLVIYQPAHPSAEPSV